MNTIYKLSPILVSKIAAGEVIERPSFALKELIENAIDANASEIKIYLEEAGLKILQVIDNGIGMSADDVAESWKPHTTSKLKDEHELHSIKSLGFRGEALSSLAAISTLTIKSRPHKKPTGFVVQIKDGILQHSAPIGMPSGTIVIAEELFARIPARKKFLKSTPAELRQCIEVVHKFAISYPTISFTLLHGKKTLIDYPKTANQAERIEQVIGNDAFLLHIPFKMDESYVSIHGFIAKPQLHASGTHKQFLFINGRSISDKLISLAVKEAYGTMLESTAYPQFVLSLTLPFEMVDVNVHPRKEQIHFANSQFIFQTIKQIIIDVLTEHNLTFQNLSWKRTGVGMVRSFAGTLLKQSLTHTDTLAVEEPETLLQFHKVYIVVSTKTNLFLIDQHAAHERILFEKLKKEFLTQKTKRLIYTLPTPIVLSLSKKELMLLAEHTKNLEMLGFQVRKNTLTHMPLLFQDRNPSEMVSALLEDLETTGHIKSVDTVSEEMLAFLACRAAVKAGDTLNETQMKTIIKELETTPNNATCPHGRPTKISIRVEELDSMFKRT